MPAACTSRASRARSELEERQICALEHAQAQKHEGAEGAGPASAHLQKQSEGTVSTSQLCCQCTVPLEVPHFKCAARAPQRNEHARQRPAGPPRRRPPGPGGRPRRKRRDAPPPSAADRLRRPTSEKGSFSPALGPAATCSGLSPPERKERNPRPSENRTARWSSRACRRRPPRQRWRARDFARQLGPLARASFPAPPSASANSAAAPTMHPLHAGGRLLLECTANFSAAHAGLWAPAFSTARAAARPG